MAEVVVTDSDREVARGALIEGHHHCKATNYVPNGVKPCDCDFGAIAGCKERLESVARATAFARKAAVGDHDENISFEEAKKLLGEARANEVRDATLALYTQAAEYAATKGIIIADTKFEFGADAAGRIHLIDEILTPDSSRFWPVAEYKVGMSPPSFDKQFVRDWLETQPWNKKAPAPRLPADIIARTAGKYREALRLLAGA